MLELRRGEATSATWGTSSGLFQEVRLVKSIGGGGPTGLDAGGPAGAGAGTCSA